MDMDTFDPDNLISVAEAARILQLSTSRVYHLRNHFSHIKMGGTKQGRVFFFKDKIFKEYLCIKRNH